MQTVIIVVHLIIVLALIGVVLLQRSEGGLGLGGGSSGVSGFMTGRGQANALTRATAYLAIAFFATSMVLGWIAAHNRAPRSILDTGVPGAPAGQQTPAGGQGPGVLEQLQRMQGGQGNQGAPSAPSTAPSTAPDASLPTGPVVPQSR